jgi:hypothetical protein
MVLTHVELAEPKQKLVSVIILNAAFITAGVIPTTNDGAGQTALDLRNIWDLRLARMSESVFGQPFEFGMRNKRTRCIKDYRCPMFPGPLLLNKFAESGARSCMVIRQTASAVIRANTASVIVTLNETVRTRAGSPVRRSKPTDTACTRRIELNQNAVAGRRSSCRAQWRLSPEFGNPKPI